MARGDRTGPEPVDVYVGKAIRAQRLRAGLNQTDLGRAVGITFQQIQKYENAMNRVSASALVKIARTLGCRPGDFFPDDQNAEAASAMAAHNLAATPGGTALETLYLEMSSDKQRTLLKLAKALADQG